MSYFEMSKLALRWAFSKSPTSNYPFEPRKALEGSRGSLVFTEENCIYCNICAKKCPTDAIVVTRAEKLWSIDRMRCITCGSCVEICPKKSLEFSTAHGAPQTTKERESYQRQEEKKSE